MDRQGLVPVMAVAIVNGIFSPWVLVVFVLYPVWYPVLGAGDDRSSSTWRAR